MFAYYNNNPLTREIKKNIKRNTKDILANNYMYSLLSKTGDLKILAELYYNKRLVFSLASQNKNITYEFTTKHKSSEWNYYYIIIKEKLATLELILNNPEIEIVNYEVFSLNVNMTLKFIEKYTHRISWNPEILLSVLDLSDIDVLINKYRIPLNKYYLSRNKHITINFIQKYDGIQEYDFSEISKNASLKQLELLYYYNLLDCDAALSNKNITKDFISKYNISDSVRNDAIIEFVKRN